jgi:hypothetical protein
MVTTEDVLRMQEQEDVDGLIQVLESDSDPLLRGLAAKILGDLGGTKARDALKRALMSGEPLVMGPASTALGQLEAKIAIGTGAPAEISERKMRMKEKPIWLVAFVTGILMIIVGCCPIGFVLLDPSTVGNTWPVLIIFVLPIGLGGYLLYLSTRPVKPNQPTED